MAMAKTTSDHKINTALSYVNAPISDLLKLNTLLGRSAADHLHNFTVLDTAAANNLEQISSQLTTKQLSIDTHLQDLIDQYNNKYQELVQIVNGKPGPTITFDNNTGVWGFNGNQYNNINGNNQITPEYAYRNANSNRVNSLVADMRNLNGNFYYGLLNLNNNNVGGQVFAYNNSLNNIQARQTEWNTIADMSKCFDHTRDMVFDKGNTFDTSLYMFQLGRIPQTQNNNNPLAYEFADANVYTVQVDRNNNLGRVSQDCIALKIREKDGTTKDVQMRSSDCVIDPGTGAITIADNPEIFDIHGLLYIPKNDYEFDINITVNYDTLKTQLNPNDPRNPNLILQSTKKLTIKRSSSSYIKSDVLARPAFTTELTNRMDIAYREHIEDVDYEESQIYKIIRGHLDKHPDFARLADSQKEELYHNVLAVTQVDHTIPGAPVPGPLLSASITATQARNTTANTMSAHSDLFAAYVQDEKVVDPKPTAEDTKDEVSYRNWLTRNLTALTKNYIGHRLTHYLGTSDVTQAVNHAITHYVTTHDRDVIDNDRDLVPNINNAVTALRGCLPVSKNNKAWTTLMTGRTAQIKDSVTYRKDTFSYTTDVVFSNAPAISATLQLNNNDPITLHGRTPGDLLAKIMTGGGARIDGQRERLHMAFGTMKAIIKSNPAYAAGLSVPINNANTGVGETNGPELRISLDAHDKIKVERYNFDAARNEMVKSPNPGDVFDESNPHDKERLTHGFIVNLNSAMNRIMDNQYTSYRDTISDAKNPFRTMSNRLGLSRERMSYKAEPRFLRGLLTKWINRKQPGVEAFSFPVTVGNQTMNVDYQPNGNITLEANGKTRKGKNLAKLLNPTSMSIFGGIFANKKNFTDGFEIPVMQGLYDGLSRQLMQNERVNQYTYLVRDPVTKIVYTMHSDQNGEPQIGVIENVTGPVSNTRTRDMLLMSRQKRGRTKGIPPQGIRQLNEAEKNAILGRPDIMDGFMQNMLKAREELIHVPVSEYRGLSLNALGLGTAATAGAGLATLGGIDLASGGLLSSSLYSVGATTNNFVTGTAPHTAWTVTNNAATALGDTFTAGTKVVAAPFKGVVGAAAA